MSTPATKKQRMNGNIENTQQDDEIFNRIKQFKSNLLKEFEPYILIKAIIDNILLYSNHTQIHNLWLNVYKKLGKYSFIMRPGCKLSEIQKFEKDHSILLPDHLRISYLICDAVMFPIVFLNTPWKFESNDRQTPQPLNFAPECIMQPINKWRMFDLECCPYFISDDQFLYQGFVSDYWRSKDNYNEFVSVFLGCNGTEYDADKYDKIFEIGHASLRWENCSISVFWNAETNKIFSFYNCSGFSGRMSYQRLYDSFEDYLKQWSKFDYYDTFKAQHLEIGSFAFKQDILDTLGINGGKMTQKYIQCELSMMDSREHVSKHKERLSKLIFEQCYIK